MSKKSKNRPAKISNQNAKSTTNDNPPWLAIILVLIPVIGTLIVTIIKNGPPSVVIPATQTAEAKQTIFAETRDSKTETVVALSPNATEYATVPTTLTAISRTVAAIPDLIAHDRIAFYSTSTGHAQIYTIYTDGTNIRRLTNDASDNGSPSWSPDGRFIAYDARKAGSSTIYVMNADGTNPRPLTTIDTRDHRPAWSPDGLAIAFVSERDDANPNTCEDCRTEIYKMRPDGTNVRRITDVKNASGPAWSPDGHSIVFDCDCDGNNDIYVIDLNGTNLKRLTDNPGKDLDASWSPDGRLIAFESNRDGNPEIYVMNVDGTNQRNLTNNASYDQHPTWSPDGRYIAFTSFRDGSSEIYFMNRDGANPQKITYAPATNFAPAWSP